MQKADLDSLARNLAAFLVESKEFSAAAAIHLDYLADIATAATLFCKGYNFSDAFRIVALHSRPDLLESTVDPGLIEGMAVMTELIAECKAQVNAQAPRILEVRKKKAEDPLAFYDGDGGPEDAGIPDDLSIAPTDASTIGGSLLTRYTNRSSGTLATNATKRTSRQNRREERKKARGKKGSVYEEEYLVNSLRRLIERVNTVSDEVQRLVAALMRRAMRERARAVEAGMIELIDLCEKCADEVYGVNAANTGPIQDAQERAKPDESFPQDLRPVIKGFQKLPLLV